MAVRGFKEEGMSCSTGTGTEFPFCMKSPEDDGGGDCTTE